MIKNRYYHGEQANPFKLEDNRERFVFWGEEAIQIRMLCGTDLENAKDMFGRHRLEFELRIVRQYRKLETFDMIEQRLVFQEHVALEGVCYDKRHYLVTCLRQPDYDDLKKLWQENNGYKDDPEGEKKHHALLQSKLIVMKVPVWFKIVENHT